MNHCAPTPFAPSAERGAALRTVVGTAGATVALDGFRAVGSMTVLIKHSAGATGFLVPYQPGAHIIDNLRIFGVAVFFLLSGLLLFRPFVSASLDRRPLPAAAPFYIKRALRIFPAYWLALIAATLSWAPTARTSGTVVGKVLLFDPYDPRSTVFDVGLGVFWTLTITVSFYVLLPVYAWLTDRVLRRRTEPADRATGHLVGLVVLAVSALGHRLLVRSSTFLPPLANTWLFAYLDWFALGMLLALASAWLARGGSLPRAIQDLADRTWACWSLAGFCFLSLVVLRGDSIGVVVGRESRLDMSMRFLLQGWGAAFFLLPAAVGRRHGVGIAVLGSRALAWLGTVSFGIYLWHPIVITWVDGLVTASNARTELILMIVVVTGITVPIAAASHRLVERPFTRLGPRRRPALPGYHPPSRPGDRPPLPIGAVTR